MTPQWYVQNVLCIWCHQTCKLRALHFCGNGTVKLIGWCSTCGKQSEFVTEPETLCIWAKHHDNPFPSDQDKDFLHDLRVSWEPLAQLSSGCEDATGKP